MELNSYIGEIDINFVLVSLLAVFLIQLLFFIGICFHDINLCRKKSKAEIDELKAEIERLSSLNDTNISHYIDLKKKMNDDYDSLMINIAENTSLIEKQDEKFDKITFQLNTHISTSNNIFDKVVLKSQDDYTFFTQQVKSLSNLISNYHQFERDVNKKISDLESKISFGSKNSKEYVSELKSMISSFNEKVEHYFDSVEQVSIKVNNLMPEQVLINKLDNILYEIRLIIEYVYLNCSEKKIQAFIKDFKKQDFKKFYGKNTLCVFKKYFSEKDDEKLFKILYSLIESINPNFEGKNVKTTTIHNLIESIYVSHNNNSFLEQDNWTRTERGRFNLLPFFNEPEKDFELRILSSFLDLIRQIYLYIKSIENFKENS